MPAFHAAARLQALVIFLDQPATFVVADNPPRVAERQDGLRCCLLYTSDAADERSSVDLGGRRIIKKKKLSLIKLCVILYHLHSLINLFS